MEVEIGAGRITDDMSGRHETTLAERRDLDHRRYPRHWCRIGHVTISSLSLKLELLISPPPSERFDSLKIRVIA